MMKKFSVILAIVASVLTSVFGFTSCAKDNDDIINSEEKKPEEEKTPETQYVYDVDGLWRFEANGVKYSLLVNVPHYETGNRYTAYFYYNDNTYPGRAELKNDILTFLTESDSNLKVEIQGTFANKDSQKFTASLSIDSNTIAKEATFNRLETPSSYVFSISYAVVDPNNEIPALGIDVQKLNDQVKAHNASTDTGNRRIDTAFGALLALSLTCNTLVSIEMEKQCKEYPGLVNTKAYVEVSVVNTFGDINNTYEKTALYYASHASTNKTN